MEKQLAAIRALIMDLDGVLWRGAQPLPGVAEFFEFLARREILFLLATNNATATTQSIIQRVAAMGAAVTPEQILTSAMATARWLQRELPAGARVLVIGEAGLFEALTRAGFEVLDSTNPAHADLRAVAVTVGLDRALTYEKLRRATSEIHAGARFIATNTDATLPTEKGVMPGAGAIIAAIQTATGVTPTVIGKPHRPLFDAALEMLQMPREQTAMLGDRLDTDIDGGRNAGLKTILVLTGVTTDAEVAAASRKPDFTFANLVELREQWAAELRESKL